MVMLHVPSIAKKQWKWKYYLNILSVFLTWVACKIARDIFTVRNCQFLDCKTIQLQHKKVEWRLHMYSVEAAGANSMRKHGSVSSNFGKHHLICGTFAVNVMNTVVTRHSVVRMSFSSLSCCLEIAHCKYSNCKQSSNSGVNFKFVSWLLLTVSPFPFQAL